VAETTDLVTRFIEASTWHGSLERAEAILSEHPEIAEASIHAAAVLGDDATVRRFIERDPSSATAKAAPYGGDALVYLCLSKYLRLAPSRTDGFLRAANALLDAGADANSGFWTTGGFPERETALYGAAGVAHHPEMTRLLLERGADPNDDEVAYHAPETTDNATVRILVDSGKLTADSLAIMLARKADWHDGDGITYLLRGGANPNRITRWGVTALHHAVRRDNKIEHIEAMLDHGGDPTIREEPANASHPRSTGRSAVALAARRGRGDLLELFERRGFSIELQGIDRLIAACARNDAASVRSIAAREPDLVGELLAQGGTLLAEFAGTANTEGVRQLLDLGVDVAALYPDGDGYFGIAPSSTALHVAACRASHETVRLLIERGALIDALDGKGRTPLALAVRACVDSYWADRRSPDSVRALLEAGASPRGIDIPSGYAEVDALLEAHRQPG
jgi:ankyrin repeat protein